MKLRSSVKKQKTKELPVELQIVDHLDSERPADEGIPKADIEYMIEKKRIRVIREDHNKAEKAKL